MALRSSSVQTNFLGGEWSPLAQGRSEDPKYTAACALLRNYVVSEEGAAMRRAGTQRLAPTNGRGPAKLLRFVSSAGCAFVIEATNDNIQMYDGPALVTTNDSQVITASSFSAGVITLTTTTNHGWSIGDAVMMSFPSGYDPDDEATCRGRVFQLMAGTGTNQLVMENDLGQFLSILNFTTNDSLVGATAHRIKRFPTTYATTDLPNLRLVQAQTDGVILAPNHKPAVITVAEPLVGNEAVFTFGNITLVDGPYLNPQSQSLTLSALTGTINLVAGSAAFASTDVGRALRIFTQPAAWASGTTYSVGNTVTDVQGAWWVSLINSNTGIIPGTSTTVGGVPTLAWAPQPNAGSWAWGTITTFTNSTHVSFTFDTTIPNMVLQSANGTTASIWQLGVFSDTTTYPTCGLYYEGRLYLAGAVPNRIDTSISNGVTNAAITFSPTDPNGNVLDSSGMSLVLNASGLNTIHWMTPDHQGVIVGADEGEWLIQASNLADPITPTSVQAHRISKYGSENIEPVDADMSMVFPQRYGQSLKEYLADTFSQRFTGRPINEFSRHLFASGVAELAYQANPVTIIWGRMNDGSLLGCTYRRVSRFVSEPPVFNAWHRHAHASGGPVTGLVSVPAKSGLADLVYIVVQDRYGFFTELVQPLVETEPFNIRKGWFVDSSPGSTVNEVRCGFNSPSLGFSAAGAVSVPWASVSSAGEPTQAAGVTLPPAGQAQAWMAVLNDGVYFNGSCMLYNLIPQSYTASKFSMSVWLNPQQDQGALLMAYANPQVFQANDQVGFLFWWLSQVIGRAVGPPNMGGNSLGLGLNSSVNTLGVSPTGWAHLMVSMDQTASTAGNWLVFVNDTNISSFFTDNSSGPTGNAFMIPPSCPLGNLTIGGLSYEQWQGGISVSGGAGNGGTDYDINGIQSTGSTNFQPNGPLPSDGGGLTAAMAEFWFAGGHYIDWTVAGNRQKFHTTDLVGARYAPVNLGLHGQLPLSAAPNVYLSGNQFQFTVNRANGLKIGTFNGLSPTQNFDPSLATLDNLPPGISPVS